MTSSTMGLAFERGGSGPPLLLLHGTNSSHRVWEPLIAALSARRDVIALDLPAHGESIRSSVTPPEWARDIAGLLDYLDLEQVAVVGHSSGGWSALELAKLGRASAVLALTPAGLWRRRSPHRTDAMLRGGWKLSQMLGERVEAPLRRRSGRRLLLRGVSGRPADVPAELAVSMARTVIASKHFPEHFQQTRNIRFVGGCGIAAGTSVRVVWGAKDRLVPSGSRRAEQLPSHAEVETWAGCGHMLMWDAPERVVDAALALGPHG